MSMVRSEASMWWIGGGDVDAEVDKWRQHQLGGGQRQFGRGGGTGRPAVWGEAAAQAIWGKEPARGGVDWKGGGGDADSREDAGVGSSIVVAALSSAALKPMTSKT
ncbi:hypothetical protein E2562_011368 [Oryza meyeriana var. granulata]|uniref:DUF834 domain-containing protein n=1 Tax=Oryza meyeriana var. granulata TaxID=110450 RepID=A0A6G1EAK9_9ORYZ|nr:hypothetical protein E2562_011368 [Oryza meyeriana var. granulata]